MEGISFDLFEMLLYYFLNDIFLHVVNVTKLLTIFPRVNKDVLTASVPQKSNIEPHDSYRFYKVSNR